MAKFIMRCQECGTVFKAERSTRKWCSLTCRNRAASRQVRQDAKLARAHRRSKAKTPEAQDQ